MAYRLTLTDEDVDAIQFSGNRYGWSDALLSYGPGTHRISESEAWRISEAIASDDAPYPLLNPHSDLYEKLEAFCRSVV